MDEVFFSTPNGDRVHVLKHSSCDKFYSEHNLKYTAYCGVTCADNNAVHYSVLYAIRHPERICQRCLEIQGKEGLR